MKRIGIFLFYDKNGIVDDYIPYMVRDMRENLDRLVIVVNGKINDSGKEKLAPFTEEIIIRENKGFDSGGWKYALTEVIGWDALSEYDELILFNDSYFGPVYPFREVFAKMDADPADFWGLASHGEVSPDPYRYYPQGQNPYGYWPEFIHSYFIAVRKRMFTSDAFHRFWEELPYWTNIFDAVGKFETIFTKHFADLGFTWDTLVHTEDLDVPAPDNHYILNLTPMLERGYPIIKHKIFQTSLFWYLNHPNSAENSHMGEDLLSAMKWLRENSGYDIRLALQHQIRISSPEDLYRSMHLAKIIRPAEIHGKQDALIVLYLQNEASFRGIEAFTQVADVLLLTNQTIHIDGCETMQVPNETTPEKALILAGEKIRNYKVFCFCHDSVYGKTPYSRSHSLNHLRFENILSSPEYVQGVLNCFEEEPMLGILTAPRPILPLTYDSLGWDDSFERVKSLCDSLKLGVSPVPDKSSLTSGNAFWAQTDALLPLFVHDWKEEEISAIERIYPYAAQSRGYLTGTVMTKTYASILLTDYEEMAVHHELHYSGASDPTVMAGKGIRNNFNALMIAIKNKLFRRKAL